MRKRITSKRATETKAANTVNMPSNTEYVMAAECMIAESVRQRMAEYCRRVSMPSDLVQMPPPSQHQGESYFPGVF